jgi:hypothetical protein
VGTRRIIEKILLDRQEFIAAEKLNTNKYWHTLRVYFLGMG